MAEDYAVLTTGKDPESSSNVPGHVDVRES